MIRRASPSRWLLLVLAALPLLLGVRCPPLEEHVKETVRRIEEGGLDSPERLAEADAAIASLVADVGGLFDETLAERMAFHGTPGLTVALIRGGRVRWVEAFGTYDSGTGAPMLRNDRMQGASLSKPVAAVAMLKLAEAGLLDLDAPLSDALVSWSVPENMHTAQSRPTVRQVLAHTAGFNASGFIGYAQGQPLPTLLQILDGESPANNAAIDVIDPPGEVWRYSGGGYTVLAQLLEDVTGESFGPWVEANVLAPAGMTRSTFEQPLPEAQGALLAHVGPSPLPPFSYPELPAAGLWTTALDMARFVTAIQRAADGETGGLLTPANAQAMLTPVERTGPTLSLDTRMGLGVFLSDGPFPGWFWHTGSNVGYNCLFVGDTRGAGDGAVVITNSLPGGRLVAWEIVNGLADLYGWVGWEDWGLGARQ